ALDRADLDLDVTDVVAVDEIELLAPRHDRRQDHRVEQCAPDLWNAGLEQVVAFQLHGLPRGVDVTPAYDLGALPGKSGATPKRRPGHDRSAVPPLRRGIRASRSASSCSERRSWIGRKSSMCASAAAMPRTSGA